MHELQIFWRIAIDPIMFIVLVAFFCFFITGPIAAVISLVLALRRRTRRLGLLMLVSGVGGYFCVATAVALRIRVYPRFPSYGAPPEPWIGSSLKLGLAGFTAFAVIALMFYFRSPMGLTKRSSQPLTGEKIST